MEGNNNIIDTVIYVLHFSFICRTNRYNGNLVDSGIGFLIGLIIYKITNKK